MTRVKADLALALAGLIWGFGFVAQKAALDHIGPFTFVAARFLISAIFILPFVLREKGLKRLPKASRKDASRILILCAAFTIAVLVQQCGMTATSVTHTAFLTGLNVVMVPIIGFAFGHHKLSLPLLIASTLSLLGVWLLSGGISNDLIIHIGIGDALILLCALGFAFQIVILGRLAKRINLPFLLSFLEYAAVGIIALLGAVLFEKIDFNSLLQAWQPILFAGIASGGIAYTLQAVAQQHTPPSDAAIIMSSEALFGGIGGVWLMHDPMNLEGLMGCAAIMGAIILVEIGPLWHWNQSRRKRKTVRASK